MSTVPAHLQDAFEQAVEVDEHGGLLPLLLAVAKMRSPHLDCVMAWNDELRRIVARNASLRPHWPDLFQFFLARHRIAVDAAGDAQ